MKLEKTTIDQINVLVNISKEAFDNDITVGAQGKGGPPEYDDVNWHIQMMKEGHLFTASDDGKIVGAAIVFKGEKRELFIGRIFIDPIYHRKGYGTALMKELEKQFSDCETVYLDTPVWNTRTNAFYCKLGYVEVKRDKEFVYYKKDLV